MDAAVPLEAGEGLAVGTEDHVGETRPRRPECEPILVAELQRSRHSQPRRSGSPGVGRNSSRRLRRRPTSLASQAAKARLERVA